MSSKKNSVARRLMGWTTLLLTFSLICVTTTVYYLLSNSLRENDRMSLTRYAERVVSLVDTRGLEALKQDTQSDLVIMLTDAEKNIRYLALPGYIDHDFEDEGEIEQIRKDITERPLKEGWRTILLLSGEENEDYYQRTEFALWKFAHDKGWDDVVPLIDNDLFTLYTKKLADGGWLVVGTSTEVTEEHLSAIRKLSLFVLIPFIILGILLSYILSRSITAPIGALASTMKLIRSGKTTERVRQHGSGDEVDQLALEFNQLLDHNDALMENLKGTVDNVAHDLRTPLTHFRSSAEKALSGKGNVLELQEALKDGLESSEKILRLLNAIMDVSEAETQTMKIHKQKINLRDFTTDLLEMYSYAALEKQITFRSEGLTDSFILADQVRLAQAIGNVLDNAVKFSSPASEISVWNEGTSLLVKDSGPGIDRADLDHIWERLYRADRSRSTHGMGIGLSVVQAIMKAHGGAASVEETSSSGTTFRLTFPVCNDPVSSL
jgi:signal transduction histidine kinase